MTEVESLYNRLRHFFDNTVIKDWRLGYLGRSGNKITFEFWQPVSGDADKIYDIVGHRKHGCSPNSFSAMLLLPESWFADGSMIKGNACLPWYFSEASFDV